MERKRVNSSKLRSVGYDEKTRTLEVEMSNGQVFQYAGVYPEVYRRFMAAPNPTSFFDDKIAEEYTRSASDRRKLAVKKREGCMRGSLLGRSQRCCRCVAFRRAARRCAASPRSTSRQPAAKIAGWLRDHGREGYIGADVADAMGIAAPAGEELLAARQRGFRNDDELRIAQVSADGGRTSSCSWCSGPTARCSSTCRRRATACRAPSSRSRAEPGGAARAAPRRKPRFRREVRCLEGPRRRAITGMEAERINQIDLLLYGPAGAVGGAAEVSLTSRRKQKRLTAVEQRSSKTPSCLERPEARAGAGQGKEGARRRSSARWPRSAAA